MKKSDLAGVIAKFGKDEAHSLLLQLDPKETEDGANEKIAAALEEVEEAQKRAELAEVTAKIKEGLLEFGENEVSLMLPAKTAFMEIRFCFTSEELEIGTSDSPQIIPAGYYIPSIKYRDDTMDKAVTLFRGAKHKPRGSNGTTVVVPVPSGAPFKSWVKHLEETYPEKDDSGKFIVKRGSGQSAPVNLQKAKDPAFLAAKQIALDDSGRQATWEEIEDATG